MRKRQKKSKDEVQPVPGWGRKAFHRDLDKLIHAKDEPQKKKRS